jgi:hypothetical protein
MDGHLDGFMIAIFTLSRLGCTISMSPGAFVAARLALTASFSA